MGMRLRFAGWGLASVVVASAAPFASATIPFYDAFYSSYYFQTSSAGPLESLNSTFYARVFSTPGDIGAATLNVPGTGPLAMSDAGDGVWLFGSFAFFSFDDVLALYPSGVYTYSISGGLLGTQDGSLNSPADLPTPSAIPRIDESSYLLLNSLPNPSQVLTVGINGFALSPVANGGGTFVTIASLNSGAVDYSVSLDPSATSFDIPANLLVANATYQLSVYYSGRIQTENAGFGSALGTLARDLVTSMLFTTGPAVCNPADICGVGATYDNGAVDIGPDGTLTIEDFLNFLSAFGDATGCPGGAQCNPADICGVGATYDNGAVDIGPDGELTIEDFLNFLSAFGDGTGCP